MGLFLYLAEARGFASNEVRSESRFLSFCETKMAEARGFIILSALFKNKIREQALDFIFWRKSLDEVRANLIKYNHE